MSIARTDVRVGLGPARGAYLVRAGDRRGFVAAIQTASTRWGGVTEPIIPVRASGRIDDMWVQVVKCSGVHGLINVSVAPSAAATAQRRLGLRLIDVRDLDLDALLGRTLYPTAVSPNDEEWKRRAVLLADEHAPLWLKVALGTFPPGHQQFRHPLPEAMILTTDTQGDLDRAIGAQVDHNTWLDFGANSLGAFLTGGQLGFTPVMVWMTRRDNLRDCVFFWNLRALRSLRFFVLTPMLLLPQGLQVDWQRLGRVIARNIPSWSDHEPSVLMGSLAVEENILKEVAGLLDLVPTSSTPVPGQISGPRGVPGPPYSFWIGRTPQDYFRFTRFYGVAAGTVAQMHGQDGRIEFPSPVGFRAPGRLIARVETQLLDGLPRRPVIASMVHSGAQWHQDSLQVDVNTQERYRIPIQVPTLEQAARALLENACDRAEVSDKGRLGRRLLEMGGHRLLLDEQVRNTAAELVTRRSNQLLKELSRLRDEDRPDEDLVQLAQRWGGTQQRRYRSASDLRSVIGKTAGASAEKLCTAGWAERGLGIDCAHCGIRSFVALEQAFAAPTCPACGASQPYKVNASTGVPEMHYRLGALIDRAADQGVVSHLLAIAVLEEAYERSFLIPGASIWFSDGTEREVDLYGVCDSMVVAGEAKTSPRSFSDDDTARQVELSATLGADTHLMAATGKIAGAAINAAKLSAMCHGIGLIVIEGESMRTLALPQQQDKDA